MLGRRKEKRKDWFSKRFLFVLREEQSLNESVPFGFTRWQMVLVFGLGLLLVFIVCFVISGYLSALYFEQKYAGKALNRRLASLVRLTDSLSDRMRLYDQYTDSLQSIFGSGGFSSGSEAAFLLDGDGVMERSSGRAVQVSSPASEGLSGLHFFSPLSTGYVTDGFDVSKGHYGVDIVSHKEEPVRAMASGRVLLASWTRDAGYVIGIQHALGYFSFYKHNSQLLKEVGYGVRVGEPIARVGNTGALTSGPHLHVELWHKGRPLDVEKVITFR